MKKIIILLLVFALLSGCTDVNLDDIDGGDEDFTQDIDETPKPFPIIIGGIEIPSSPQRVVSLSPSLSEIIYELGYGSRIIGRGSYCNYPPVILGTPEAGSSANPDVDSIIALSPSLVLTTAPISQKDMFRLEQEGIVTLVIPPSSGLNALRDAYRAIGLTFEGVFTGAEKGDEAFSVISRACDNTGVVNIGSFIYVTKDLKVATGDTLESAIFSCFGINLAASGTDYTFDLSALADKQPDIILLNERYTADSLLHSDEFGTLDAVLAGRIIYIDNSYFERPSARLEQMLAQFLTDYSTFR